jgi:vacuolar-type H+-ATPase subunit I/STV1
MKVLNNTDFTDKFPMVDRTYADPTLPMQIFGLISFTPAKGATPNENGVFGFAKLRGNYPSEIEASQRAEFLIRNVDSYHQIYHTYVGRPFPITTSSKYSAETDEIDIRKETANSVSNNIKEKRSTDDQQIKEIKQREEKLLAESKREEIDTYDDYITQRVKLAQLSFTYLEHQKKMAEVKDIIIKTRGIVEDLDKEFPDYKDSYYEKYMQARRDAGLKETKEYADSNFIKFLVEDADLGF